MMDPQIAAKKLTQLVKAMGGAYALIAATVLRLPVPMNLPAQAADPSLALRSLDLAWDLMASESIPSVTRSLIRDMITAWAGAYEITVTATSFGPAPWRLRAIEDAVQRITAAAADVDRHLSGDFSKDKLTAEEMAEVATWIARQRGIR